MPKIKLKEKDANDMVLLFCVEDKGSEIVFTTKPSDCNLAIAVHVNEELTSGVILEPRIKLGTIELDNMVIEGGWKPIIRLDLNRTRFYSYMLIPEPQPSTKLKYIITPDVIADYGHTSLEKIEKYLMIALSTAVTLYQIYTKINTNADLNDVEKELKAIALDLVPLRTGQVEVFDNEIPPVFYSLTRASNVIIPLVDWLEWMARRAKPKDYYRYEVPRRNVIKLHVDSIGGKEELVIDQTSSKFKYISVFSPLFYFIKKRDFITPMLFAIAGKHPVMKLFSLYSNPIIKFENLEEKREEVYA